MLLARKPKAAPGDASPLPSGLIQKSADSLAPNILLLPRRCCFSKFFRQISGIFSFFRVKLCLRYPKNTATEQKILKRRKEAMSAKNNNQLNVPEARAAMDKFKMEAASEVGVPSTY